MTTVTEPDYNFAVEIEGDDEFKRYLQEILREYHETAYPLMEVPKSKRFMVRVTDEKGRVVGGAQIWAYWGWLDVSLLALEKEVRGRGLGQQLMTVIEEKAREQGCTRIRVETFGHEMGFYQSLGYRIVGHLEDYPEGYSYYWMRKDLLGGGSLCTREGRPTRVGVDRLNRGSNRRFCGNVMGFVSKGATGSPPVAQPRRWAAPDLG